MGPEVLTVLIVSTTRVVGVPQGSVHEVNQGVEAVGVREHPNTTVTYGTRRP